MTRKTTLRRLAIHSGCVAITMLWGLAHAFSCPVPALDVSFEPKSFAEETVRSPSAGSSGNVVVWRRTRESRPRQRFLNPSNTHLFKDKQFSPHLLVVPIGSTVDFPNLDPFFHNVFADQFNGKRFDLGLYEAHSHRRREVRSRWRLVHLLQYPPRDGRRNRLPQHTLLSEFLRATECVVLHGVPPGSYRLNLWADKTSRPDRLNALSRPVEVSPRNTDLGTFVP